MKKIITSVIFTCLLCLSAQADNVGLKITSASLDATGSHTTNSTTSGALGGGGAAVNASGSADFEMASIFVEKTVELNGINLALGIDFIPMTAEVDKIGGGDGFDATVEVGNVVTIYIQPSIDLGGVTLFARAGMTEASLDISNIARQATTAGTASTDVDPSDTLEGVTYGVGIQKDMSMGPLDFVRLEATETDFDEISFTNSNGKIVKADSELQTISISFGKSF